MKKLKNLKNIKKNKSQLEQYLSEFKYPDEFKKLFNEDSFNCGKSVFKNKMRKIISMPKIGRGTISYWTSRGWNENEAENLRTKRKYDSKKSPMNVNYWINKGFSEDESLYKIKSQRKTNIEYWIEKGYSKKDAEIKRNEFQLKSNKKFVIKYKTDEDFKKMCDSKRTNSIDYWLNKGYSKEESKEKLSNRQKTFSKDICIKKYGKDKGIETWKKRQDKWLKSLEKSNYDGHSKKGIKLKERIKKHDIEGVINSLSLKNKKLFINIFKKCNTIEDFIESYGNSFNENDEIKLYKILLPIKKLKILKIFYNTTESHIMSLIIPKISRVKSMYSYYSWFNNHICRSDGEYIIANFLFKNNINYIYEKKYDNSKYRCDFYLTKYNLYIEYLGMKKDKENPYKTKLNYLDEKNINYISSNDVDEIKMKISNYVNITNKRII